MAIDKEKGAKHLTSLDFDVSAMWEQFTELERQLPLKAKEIGEKVSASLNEAMKTIQATNVSGDSGILGFSEKNISDAKTQIDELAKTYSEYAKTVIKYNSEMQPLTSTITYDDTFGKKQVEQFEWVENEWQKTTTQMTDDTLKRYKAEEKAREQALKEQAKLEEQRLKEQAKLEEQMHKEWQSRFKEKLKDLTATNVDIKPLNEYYKNLEIEIQKQISAEQKKQKLNEKNLENINQLIIKQKSFNEEVSRAKQTVVNKQVISDSTSYIKKLNELAIAIKNGDISAEQAQKQISQYNQKLKELNATADRAGTATDNMLRTITDKARWLSAFYLVNGIKEAFLGTITAVKETEDAVVELQRVLNEDVTQTKLSKGLSEIAFEYGRTFDEVQETAVKFAQTGMSWNDVLLSTRNTMLAVNTAELEITQATEGLIATWSQWGLEAKDMADIIDKVNITADNFTVTSEKIVAALQRVSGTAKNANLSLEQTIGVITALSEGTGRSGENIGTALNSLIAYTQKAGSLDVFAGLSKGMTNVVNQYQTGAISIYELWKNLSYQLNTLSVERQETLAKLLSEDSSYSEFATELESTATEVTKSIKDVYSSVGTFRQNYFVALLNGIGTAENAITGMANATGYSISENQKYLETLTAQYNQLKETLREIAVQYGESGFLEQIKIFVQLSTAILQTTKNVGGLNTVIPLVVALFLKLQATKVNDFLGTLNKNVVSNISSFQKFIISLTTAEGRAKALKSANLGLAQSFSLVLTALSLINVAVNLYNNYQEKQMQLALESANANLQQANGIKELRNQYDDLIKNLSNEQLKTADLSSIKDTLIKQYGYEKEALDTLNNSREKGVELLDKEYAQNLTLAYADIVSQYEKMAKVFSGGQSFFLTDEFVSNEQIEKLKEYGIIVSGIETAQGMLNASLVVSGNGLIEQSENAKLAQLALRELGVNSSALDTVVTKMNKNIQDNGENFNTQIDIVSRYFVIASEKYSELREQVKDTDSLEAFVNAIIEAEGGTRELDSAIQSVAYGLFPEFSKQLDLASESVKNLTISAEFLETLKSTFDELSKSVDTAQSSIDTLYSAMEQYNEQQKFSVDSLQSVLALGYEYISMLDFTENGLVINENAVRNLITAQNENIQSMIDNAEATAILEATQKYVKLSTEQASEALGLAKTQADYTAMSIEQLSLELAKGANAWEVYWQKAKDVGVSDKYKTDLKNDITDIQNTFNSLRNSYSTGITSFSKQAQQTATNASKTASDNAKKLLEEQKKAIKERYDAEIAKLKEVEEANERIRKQEEYWRKRREIQDNIAKASTRSGVEYREQESEARQQLADLDREWQETLADWTIEDKIKQLETLRDAEISAIDAQIARIGEATSSLYSGVVSSNSNANTQMLQNYTDEYLKPIEETTSETYDSLFAELPSGFEKATEQMLLIAKLNSVEMYNMYNTNFLSKMKLEISNIHRQMMGLGFIGGYMSNLSPYVTNNNTTSNTTNSKVYANIYGENTASGFASNLFKNP